MAAATARETSDVCKDRLRLHLLGPELYRLKPFFDIKEGLKRNGIQLIVDKIETEREVVDILDMDVELGQGYLFGEPKPVRVEVTRAGDGGSTSLYSNSYRKSLTLRAKGRSSLSQRERVLLHFPSWPDQVG